MKCCSCDGERRRRPHPRSEPAQRPGSSLVLNLGPAPEMRPFLGFLLGILIRCWTATLRVRMELAPELEQGRAAPWVLAFWHGQQMLLAAGRRRRDTVTLVSLSRDGSLQTGVMRALGLVCVRGSSSRGAAAGLRAMVRALRAGRDAVVALDGPRGPLRRAKSGAAGAARLSGVWLVPVSAAASRSITLRNTWDRFEIPWPFARVVIRMGAPLTPEAALDEPALLEEALNAARGRALEVVSRRTKGAPMSMPATCMTSRK